MFAQLEDYRDSDKKKEAIKILAKAYYNAKKDYDDYLENNTSETYTAETFANIKVLEYKMNLSEWRLNGSMEL